MLTPLGYIWACMRSLSFTWRKAGLTLAAGFALASCASITPDVTASSTPPLSPIDPYAPPRILSDMPATQCVPFARQASGIEIYGDASTWWAQADGKYPRSATPAPGAVLVMRGYSDASRGHVAVVTAVVSSRLIRVDQANWLNQGEVSLGVPVMDVSPTNDWSEVRVWYIPSNDWGARIYAAEGFIHPYPHAGA